MPTLQKSPGEDGYTNEFYKKFSKLVTAHLSALFNSAATSGSLPIDMLCLIITTIPKPEKDPTSMTNYRPISFLNTNVKIFAKDIAPRLLKCLPSLVQVGFMPDRQAPNATRKVINFIHQINRSQTLSLLLSLGTEKALDRVIWGFLKAVLSKFGITGWFQFVILSLYSNPSARVLTDGTLSKPFRISKRYKPRMPALPSHFYCNNGTPSSED